jgi:hypothetical protein
MPDFGLPLAEAVAPELLAEEGAKLHAWEDAHPELVAEIRTLVEHESSAKK